MPRPLLFDWMLAFILYDIVLLVAVALCHAFSQRNNGLVGDSISPATQFSWRFLPTLLAVSSTLIHMIVFDAVKRTEVIARLSRGYGASAAATVNRPVGTLWKDLLDCFPRKQNDYRYSSAMLLAVVAYILSFLIITPISSALLTPEEVIFDSKTTFTSIAVNSKFPMQPAMGNDQYFRIMGIDMQNVTTSSWISSKYTVTPFWPESLDRPDGPHIPVSAATWIGDTTVYQTDLECENLMMYAPAVELNLTTYLDGDREWNSTLQLATAKLSTPSGCEIGFAMPYESTSFVLANEILFWSTINTINIKKWYVMEDSEVEAEHKGVLLNHTAACRDSYLSLSAFSNSTTGEY